MVTLQDLEKDLPVGYDGVSAARLVEVAESRNVSVRGILTTLEELDSQGLPAILHVNGNHFVAFVGFVGDRILLFDNGIGLLDCTKDWFEHHYRWNGIALVIGKTSLFAEQSGQLLVLLLGTVLLVCGMKLWRVPRGSAP